MPTFTVDNRKGCGLGARGMTSGSFHASVFTIARLAGQFGGLGMEGQVKQPLCIDLAAISVPAEHCALYESLVVEAYERGRTLNIEWLFDIDNVIDSAAAFVFHVSANRSLSVRSRTIPHLF